MRNIDDIIRSLDEDIQQRESEHEKIQAELESIQTKEAGLREEIERLRAARGSLNGGSAQRPLVFKDESSSDEDGEDNEDEETDTERNRENLTGEIEATARERRTWTLGDASEMILRIFGVPLHGDEIIYHLAPFRLQPTRDTLNSAFRKDVKRRFERVEPNTWVLRN